MKQNHLNLADANNNIYCHKVRDVVELTDNHFQVCASCPMFAGTVQGNGVECYWNDARKLEQPYFPDDPVAEKYDVEKHNPIK